MTAAATAGRVVVVLCGHGAEPGEREALRLRLADSLPGGEVVVDADVCRRPERVPELVARTGAGRLVLGVCDGAAAGHVFQAWARKAGLDPFALELVGLNGSCGREGAALLLSAAAARLRAFPGSEPEQLKLRLLPMEGRRSRRSLFTLPPTTYEAVPSVAEERCLGGRRCGLCVQACPVAAIEARDGRLAVERESCEACGLCVSACPAGAIGFPGSSLPEREAELGALLAAESPRLVFTCRQAAAGGRAPLAGGWLPVEVPCLGMVTPGWVLQALAGGAPAVALLACGDDCAFHQGAVVRGRVEYVRALLALLGEVSPSDRVRARRADLAKPAPDPGRARGGLGRRPGSRSLTLTEPAATAEAVLGLAESYGAAPGLSLVNGASPLGLVNVREETCTACGACAAVCPTGALALAGEGDELALSFDAALCTGCGRCLPACPEAVGGALRVDAVTDLVALAAGRVTLKRDVSVPCRRCGRPIAPSAVLDRIAALLEGEEGEGELLQHLTQLCSECRGFGEIATIEEQALGYQ